MPLQDLFGYDPGDGPARPRPTGPPSPRSWPRWGTPPAESTTGGSRVARAGCHPSGPLLDRRRIRVADGYTPSQGDHLMSDNDTGPKAGISGIVEDVKGKVKEVAGTVTGKQHLEEEGRAQQDKAAADHDVARKEAEAEKSHAEAEVAEAKQRAAQHAD